MLYSRHGSGHSVFPGQPWHEKPLPHTILLSTVPLHHACPSVIHYRSLNMSPSKPPLLVSTPLSTHNSSVQGLGCPPPEALLYTIQTLITGHSFVSFSTFGLLNAVLDSPLFLPLPTSPHGSELWPFWNLPDVSVFAYVSQISTINFLLYHT